MLQNARRHLGRAAEFARQGPFGAGAVAENAAEHLGAGRDARDLFDFRLAVDRKEPHAERIGARDVTLLLDRIAEADAIGRRAGGEDLLDLDDGRRVEARAERGEEREHFRRRIGFHGIEDARIRQRLGEADIVFAHDVEIDDEARSVVAPVASALGEEIENTVGHCGPLARRTAPRSLSVNGHAAPFARARWRRDERWV